MDITGDNFITPEKTNTGWSLSLNNSTVVGASIASNVDGNKKVPTVNAVTTRVNDAITLHERNKNHLGFDQISFALSGGHLANKISNELKESSKYSFEYVENISASGINHAGLIVNNKSPKGLNAIFRKLTIKKVQPINVSKLYAHVYKTSQRDITSGLLENGEYILTLEADITTPGEIILNFGNELIISKEYYYGIKFTESETVASAEFVLNYDNFANVNYDPSSSDPSYPSLITNKVVTDTVIEDITYNIPCIMEFEDYEIPTSNAVKNYTDTLFENKVEALPSVYTGNNEVYVNCYGFEYTNPSENSIFDKIEIKFAKNLDTLTAFKAPDAPEISSGEVENNICKITVAKAKVSSTDTEIEIATSDYNTNISNEVNLSQFKFSKNIILEKGWNYRFYFYDKNDNLFAASVILNTSPERDSLLPRNSVANRYLSERYDYWGAYNFISTGLGVVANGLAVKLINSVQEHINDDNKHITEEDRERWNKGGNIQITGDDFINPELVEGGWDISLNTATTIDTSNNTNNAKTVPTVEAVKTYVDNLINGYAKESSDIIWNLNDLLVSCINDTDKSGAKWVQELLRLSATVNNGFISIADYEAIYNTSNLVEATEKWIAEASDPNRSLSTQLVFKQDSYVTNQLFRLFFYNLDHKLQKTYGADDSISKKFMKRGLTFRYLTKLESEMVLERPNEGFGKPRYKYIILRYRGEVANPPAGKVEIDWNHIPNINNTVNSTSTADIFQMAKAWDIIDNEEYNNSNIIKTNIEDLDERIAVIEGTTDFNTLETQPSETTQWIAIEFKETESIKDIINKKIRGISIKVTNTVSSPQFLAVFDTRTSGIKKLLGVSKGTTWNANETAVFKFSSSIIIPGSFEIFLLDNPISTDLTGDPNKPSNYIESYSLSGNQSYRNIDGNWGSSKRSFYLTFNFVGDRMTAAEKNIEEHLEDNERHITADERDSWNKNISSTYSIKTLVPNEYSVNSTERSGAFTTFVLPNNFYPANVQFNSIKIDTLNINGTTPTEAYLGVMALYSDGTKKALSISDNTNLSGTKGSPVWYFSTPFTIKEDYKLIFYILKDKESFIEPEPIVDKNVAIGAMVYNTDVLDPYDKWDEAQTNLNFGFIVNGDFIKNNAWPSWPACTLYKLNHVNNQDIHITDSERTKWNSALYTISEGDYIDISDDSTTISVTNITDSISNNTSDSLVTEASVIKYADDTKDENGNIIEEGLLTKWHKENEYFHMQKSVADSLKSFNLDNYGVGDVCKGVIMNLPYLSKIKSISLVAVTASSYNQPIASKAMTWSNYRLKMVDVLSGEVLATSEIGKNANTAANTSGKGYPIGVFDFVEQIYYDAARDYQILFVNAAGETATIELAYANGNGSYATYENYTFGELSPKVILSDGTIKEHPQTFSVADQTAVACKGYACDFAVDTVKSEELTHLSKQIGILKNYIAYMNTYISQIKN